MNDEWGREWRSANLAYGSSVYSLASAHIVPLSCDKEVTRRGDLHVLLDDDVGSTPGISGEWGFQDPG